MITNICLLLEALSIVFCIHCLYGENFRLDITTTCFLAVHMIVMTVINYYKLPTQYTMLMYPIFFIYCGVKFTFNIKQMLINFVMCAVIVGGIQSVAAWPLTRILAVTWFSDYILLIANFLAFLIIVFFVPKCRIYKITDYLLKKEIMQIVILIICIILITFLFFEYKAVQGMHLEQAILLLISIACIFALTGQLGKYKLKAKEVETELKMHELYADSFQGLIENIRLRQHEFDNHINTIYSQHYVYKTYEELVNAQEAYCKAITKDNRFNKLLSANNLIIAGFLYGKFMEIDKIGIDVTYNVNIMELDIKIPDYKIVEILSDFINNAVDALEKADNMKKLYISFIETNGLEIEVRNESPFIDYNIIEKFFSQGYSSKGENRGLGLYNVKKICSEYGLDIYCENVEICDTNWLSFKVIGKKDIAL